MSLDKDDVVALMINLELTKSCSELRMKYQHGKIKRVVLEDSAITLKELVELQK